MAIITFLSDFGLSGHYVAAVKAKILSFNPNITIVDVTHLIPNCDIKYASYILKSIYGDFPKGTVHLCGISKSGIQKKKYVAVKYDEHYFVGEDSGLFSTICNPKPTAIVDVNSLNSIDSTSFSTKDILALAAAKIASGSNIYDLGMELDSIKEVKMTSANMGKELISGSIEHINHFGNLITNIVKKEFEQLHAINDHCPIEISFRKEKLTRFNNNSSEVSDGECFAYFNSSGYLEIGINNGSGTQLLGLEVNNQVFIKFLLEGKEDDNKDSKNDI